MFKKILSLGFVCVILAGMLTSVSAAEVKEDHSKARIMSQEYIDSIKDNDPLKHYAPSQLNFMCEPLVTRSTTISVPVTEPCDQYFRANYPSNWMWQANRAVSNAAEPLKKFGIQYYSVSQKYWESNSTSSSALVAEAKSEWGLKDGASLMIAFSGRNVGGIFGQVDAIGDPYVIVYDYGYDENKMTVLHETAHCYGMYHCAAGTNCVVAQAAPISTFNSLCNTHSSQWEARKNWY